MSNSFKQYGGIIILVILEVWTFLRIETLDLQSFFFIWALFPFILLLYFIFGAIPVRGINPGNSMLAVAEFINRTPEGEKKLDALPNKSLLLLLIFILLNLIGYIVARYMGY